MRTSAIGLLKLTKRESKTIFKTAYTEFEIICRGKLTAQCPQNTLK
jgi:hypothetical protein